MESALEKHAKDGDLTENRVYIGDTKHLPRVLQELENSAASRKVASTRVFARLSCKTKESGKYHLVSIYQTERDKGGRQIQVLQATWTPRSNQPLDRVVSELHKVVEPIIHSNEKYGSQQIKIVGSLHLFQDGKKPPPRISKDKK